MIARKTKPAPTDDFVSDDLTQSQEDQLDQDSEQAQIEQLKKEAQLAHEAERRALADYQNLIRRQQQDRSALAKMANRELISDLLQPLDHLELAAAQIQDQGLDMVLGQLWQKLGENGLEMIEVMGKKFDAETMEAVDTQSESAADSVVIEVRRSGFKLNGQVIRHAQVVMGNK